MSFIKLAKNFFSDIPQNVQMKLENASSEELEKWLDMLLESKLKVEEEI